MAAKKKYYAVRVGKNPGIYNSWDECKEQVDGFSGATYKGFVTLDDAEEYMRRGEEEALKNSADSANDNDNKEPLSLPLFTGEKGNAVAYVDGSYDKRKKAFSYGMVIIKDGVEYHENKKFLDDPLAKMHNVAGEIKGAEAAMQYALDHGFESIIIYHDYEGISKWCLGEWEAHMDGTKAYRDFFKQVSQSVMISFVKVAAHTGDYYNEMADRLAKSALGIL